MRVRDRRRVCAFLHRLSPATVKARFLGGVDLTGSTAEHELTRLLSNEHAHHMVVVAVADGEIRSIGEYIEEMPGRAEVGMVVEDTFQGRGIGKRLFRTLARRAKAHGIQMFTGDVAAGNYRLVALLRGGGQSVRT